MQSLFRFLILCLWAQLSGCASGLGPEAESLASLVRGDLNGTKNEKAFVGLNPAFRYLRVELDGAAPVLMVLGYVDAQPDGMVEVWYSALGEVIRTQNGRIVSTSGLPLDWTRVTFTKPPPPWVGAQVRELVYERQRDEVPSYRFGLKERVQATFFATPKAASLPFALPSSLSPDKAVRLRWVRERVTQGVGPGLPDAWFALGGAVGRESLVFSRQCLSVSFCLNLQAWPVQEEAL